MGGIIWHMLEREAARRFFTKLDSRPLFFVLFFVEDIASSAEFVGG